MPITVNTNMSSIIAQKSLLNSTNSMSDALKRLSTGVKINSSKDDASGKTISDKIEYKNRSYSVAMNNAQMDLSMLDTANGNLSKMNDLLQKMRDLTEQASNGTYSDADRKAMQSEIDELSNEIYRIKNSTEFNGKNSFGEEEQKIQRITESEAIAQGYTVVKNAEELYSAFFDENGNSKQYAKVMLFADINMNDLGSLESSGSNWAKISQYSGVFDGNGYTIYNLNVNSDHGFFTTLARAEIRNLNFVNSKVSSNEHTALGTLANSAGNHSLIENINIYNATVTQNSTTDNYAGGLVGHNGGSSTISQCFVSGNISYSNANRRLTGGIAGANYGNAYIKDSYSDCTIIGSNEAGGIVGINGAFSGSTKQNGFIVNCYSTSKFINCNNVVGGIAGTNRDICNAIVENSFYDKDVSGISDKNKGTPLSTNEMKQAKTFIEAGWDTSIWLLKDGNYPTLKTTDTNDTEISVKTNLQVGINSDKTSVIEVDTGFSLGNLSISLLSEFSAQNSLSKLDNLMNKINNKMTELGATQNRLENIIQYQQTQKTTLTATNSIIKDTDIAKESSRYIKNQILQNISASLLSTANQSPSIALQLINSSNNLNTNKLKTNIGFD